jgi:hypothetical protein
MAGVDVRQLNVDKVGDHAVKSMRCHVKACRDADMRFTTVALPAACGAAVSGWSGNVRLRARTCKWAPVFAEAVLAPCR